MNKKKETIAELWQRIEKLQDRQQRIKLLGSKNGFLEAFFRKLPNAETRNEAFNDLNEEYYEIFGEYRFTSYDSFRASYRNTLSNRRDNGNID